MKGRRLCTMCLIQSLLLGIFLGGCSKKGEVIARVGDEVITVEDLKAELQKLRREPDESDVRRTLDRLVNDAKFIAEAKKRGIHKSPDFINEVENFKRNLLIRKLNEDIFNESQKEIPEEQLREFYEKNINLYKGRKTFVINHITAAEKKIADEILGEFKRSKDLKKSAMKIMAKYPAKVTIREREFVELPAERYGVDFSNALEKMNNGDVSGVIKGSDVLFHIVEVISRRDIPERTFDQVRENIKARLLAQARSESMNEMRKRMDEKYRPEIYNDRLNKLIQEYKKLMGGEKE